MTYNRPNRPNQPTPPQGGGGRNNPPPNRPNLGNGGNRNRGNQPDRSRDRNPVVPSPWLTEEPPTIANTQDTFVSFVEYLRWMRAPGLEHKDVTKVQILQLAAEKSKTYRNRLQELSKRTELIAGKNNTFKIKSTWRSRVGGHRGPESILLPAFDALGIPYLPSSTLRGVARNAGIKEFMAEGMSYSAAVQAIAPYFGSIETDNPKHRSGKVIFLDAYPLANQSEYLAVDMANNLWKWNGTELDYKANPNPFISLKESTFLVGIKKTVNCDDKTFDRVKEWLITGLQTGIGSQINSGYGAIDVEGKTKSSSEILQVKFTIEGQLIHGQQKFNNIREPFKRDRDGQLRLDGQGRIQPDTIAVAEVRPIAFKSMLRYWFRAFALGVLPTQTVQELEGKIFGAILPTRYQGLIKVNIVDRHNGNSEPAARNDDVREQSGTLIIGYATTEQSANIAELIKNLTWMMFHLGGVGQGARRPCYYRGGSDRDRPTPPFYRGSTLFPEGDKFWSLPKNLVDFQQLFQQRLGDFYRALAQVTPTPINTRQPAEQVTGDRWKQAIDANCQIIVCAGDADFGKPYALATLHAQELKRNGNYDPDLCGEVRGNSVKTSPVWICDLGEYQVVTIFGANVDPRLRYVNKLRADSQAFKQIFPL